MKTANRSAETQQRYLVFQSWRFTCVIELFGLLVFTGVVRPTTARGGHHVFAIYIDLIFFLVVVVPSFVVFQRKYRAYSHSMRSDRISAQMPR